jgi:hypothetical protein
MKSTRPPTPPSAEEPTHEGSTPFRRLNITIREDQYQWMARENYSISALIRDLLDDRFASSKVVLALSPSGKKLYDALIGKLGVQDVDLEPFFLEALGKFLNLRIEELSALQKQLKRAPDQS